MIWFACKQCGKRHGRPDEAAGTVVFCDCGQGIRVPWTSTESADGPEPPATQREDEWDRPQRRLQPAARHDPNYCLNHPDTASQHTCADCGEAFCADCVVALQGEMLCGPCKNFRIRSLHRPARPSGLAIGSLILGLIGGPFAYCLAIVTPQMMQASADVGGSPAVGMASQKISPARGYGNTGSESENATMAGLSQRESASSTAFISAAPTASLQLFELAVTNHTFLSATKPTIQGVGLG